MFMLPAKDQLTICFAHGAYRMAERFAARATGIRHLQVPTADQLTQALPDADVVVVSMMWKNQQIDLALSGKAQGREQGASGGPQLEPVVLPVDPRQERPEPAGGVEGGAILVAEGQGERGLERGELPGPGELAGREGEEEAAIGGEADV